MSFELRPNESVGKGVRRIVRKQLSQALSNLSDKRHGSLDERIHAVRKSLKRVRAVVRLVRYSMGDSAYRFENESLRDTARPLSEVRDAKVLLEALSKLRKKSRKSGKNLPFAQAKKKLLAYQRRVAKKVLDDEDAVSAAAAAIEEALQRLDDWTAVKIDWPNLGDGIKRVYGQGRKAFDNVKSSASVENLHEWRKQVKHLRHQLELLAPAWPKVVGRLASDAEALGEVLGEDHDLAVLRSKLTAGKAKGRGSKRMASLTKLIDCRRETLQGDAIPQGELLYRDSPKQFVHRLRAYWKNGSPKRKRKRAANC